MYVFVVPCIEEDGADLIVHCTHRTLCFSGRHTARVSLPSRKSGNPARVVKTKSCPDRILCQPSCQTMLRGLVQHGLFPDCSENFHLGDAAKSREANFPGSVGGSNRLVSMTRRKPKEQREAFGSTPLMTAHEKKASSHRRPHRIAIHPDGPMDLWLLNP